jgi:hypothetical protein
MDPTSCGEVADSSAVVTGGGVGGGVGVGSTGPAPSSNPIGSSGASPNVTVADQWNMDILKQRNLMLENLVKERNRDIETLMRDLKVQQSIAKNAQAIETENLKLKRRIREMEEKQLAMERENKELKIQLGQREHKETMSRFDAMLKEDRYDEAGPVAAWEREQQKANGVAPPAPYTYGGAGVGQLGGATAASPFQSPHAAGVSTSGAKGLLAPVTIKSSHLSSIGFSNSTLPNGLPPPAVLGARGPSQGTGSGMPLQQQQPPPPPQAPPPPPLIGPSIRTAPFPAPVQPQPQPQAQPRPVFSANHNSDVPSAAEIQLTMALAMAMGDDPELMGDSGNDVTVTDDEVNEAMQRAIDEAKVEEKEEDELESRFRKLMEFSQKRQQAAGANPQPAPPPPPTGAPLPPGSPPPPPYQP